MCVCLGVAHGVSVDRLRCLLSLSFVSEFVICDCLYVRNLWMCVSGQVSSALCFAILVHSLTALTIMGVSRSPRSLSLSLSSPFPADTPTHNIDIYVCVHCE